MLQANLCCVSLGTQDATLGLRVQESSFRVLGGSYGDLVSRLIVGIIRATILVIGVANLLTKSP